MLFDNNDIFETFIAKIDKLYIEKRNDLSKKFTYSIHTKIMPHIVVNIGYNGGITSLLWEIGKTFENQSQELFSNELKIFLDFTI